MGPDHKKLDSDGNEWKMMLVLHIEVSVDEAADFLSRKQVNYIFGSSDSKSK